jgi:amidohydrolase
MVMSRVKVFLLTMSALAAWLCSANAVAAQALRAEASEKAEAVAPRVISWRRDIHQHPELSNREFRTAKLVAAHLRALGFDEVRTGVAHTGVIGILKGGKPGGSVALRADMDALPVAEEVDLPFASKLRTTYNNHDVGVMHACGHDAHTAILMGVAEVLAALKAEIPGTVRFIFQPAEEGTPEGEKGGAEMMVAEGALDGPNPPTAIFGLHVWPGVAGNLYYRAGGIMAGSNEFTIKVRGRQTHGAVPWRGIDPVTVSAQIILALQTIPSRQMDITKAPSLITIGSIHGGVRNNIIPGEVLLDGTIRILDPSMQEDMFNRIRRTATDIASSAGAAADVNIQPGYPVTYNDPELTRKMTPTLAAAAGGANIHEMPAIMGAEDFSYYQRKIPGLYFFLGINKPGVPPEDAAPNHSPKFYVNEDALVTGVKALSALAIDYLESQAPGQQ